MLQQQVDADDSAESESWFERAGSRSSSALAWLQLCDFFSMLKMFNLCISASLQGLRLITDDSPPSARQRLCIAMSESHCNLGNVSEAIRFMNLATQEYHMYLVRRKRKERVEVSDPVLTVLSSALQRSVTVTSACS
jgi:hypothetical protein